MRRLRHGLASVFFAIGKRLDTVVFSDYGPGQFGELYPPHPSGATSTNVQVHTDDATPIGGSFKPEGTYTYAALHVGRGVSLTLFLTHTTTLRLLSTLRQIEAGFAKYGERKS